MTTISEKAYSVYGSVGGTFPVRTWAEKHGCTTERGLMDYCLLLERDDFHELHAALWLVLMREEVLG